MEFKMSLSHFLERKLKEQNESSGSALQIQLKKLVSVNKVGQSTTTKGFVQRGCTVVQCYFFNNDTQEENNKEYGVEMTTCM